MQLNEDLPFVSVVIPSRNAHNSIADTLHSIEKQQYDGEMEIIVADGSDDLKTWNIVSQQFPQVRIVSNHHHNTPSGMNIGISEAIGDIIIRCDSHTILSDGYISKTVSLLQSTGAGCVGGVQLAVGKSFFGKAVSIAMSGVIGNGGSKHKTGGKAGPVDTVYMGSFWRKELISLGLYNENMIRNQDYELNYRIRMSGKEVYFSPELMAYYTPRSNWISLAKQYFQYGFWKSKMLRQYPRSVKMRQLFAPALVTGLLGSICISLFYPWLSLVFPLSYLLVLLAGSSLGVTNHGWKISVLLPIIYSTMHISWGVGFLLGLAKRK